MAKNGIKDDVFLDVKPKDLLKRLSLRDQTVELDINVPDNFIRPCWNSFWNGNT